MSTRVRLTDAKEFPIHGSGHSPKPAEHTGLTKSRDLWPKYRGAWITIGAPVVPEPGRWNCGTDVVFPVLDGPMFGDYDPETVLNICVCRHQIQAGD